ncbi:hypothetical protein ANO14919_117170 [Xylariales sp. No.14919]|nr:hypothetical protein ANO14919_117170 [Xylariales sp. No.14919]
MGCHISKETEKSADQRRDAPRRVRKIQNPRTAKAPRRVMIPRPRQKARRRAPEPEHPVMSEGELDELHAIIERPLRLRPAPMDP